MSTNQTKVKVNKKKKSILTTAEAARRARQSERDKASGNSSGVLKKTFLVSVAELQYSEEGKPVSEFRLTNDVILNKWRELQYAAADVPSWHAAVAEVSFITVSLIFEGDVFGIVSAHLRSDRSIYQEAAISGTRMTLALPNFKCVVNELGFKITTSFAAPNFILQVQATAKVRPM